MKSLSKLVEQYGLMAIAIMVAVGFSGVFTYSSLVNTGSTGGNNGPQEGPSLPSSNIVEGGFDLGMREQAFLGYRNSLVFVTLFQEENSSVDIERESLVSDFENRIYITAVEGDTSALAAELGYTDFPRAVAVSGGLRGRRLAPRVEEANITETDIKSASCNVMNNWGSLQSMCYSATR